MNKKTSLLPMFSKLFAGEGPAERFESLFALSLLLTLSVVYFYLFGTGILVYQENNSLFIFSADYFKKFADKPGGLLNYAGNFLTQFYYNPLTGSLIISFLLLLIFIVFQKITRVLQAGRPFSILFTLLPTYSFLLLMTRYDIQVYHLLGLLIVITWFLLSIVKSKTLIQVIVIILFPVLYYLAGSWSIVYLGLIIVFNLMYQEGNRRYMLPLSLIITASITFIIFKDVLFFQPLKRMIEYPLFTIDSLRSTACLSFFSSFIILLPLFIKFMAKVSPKKKVKRFVPLITILTIFTLTLIILIKNYDRARANVMKVEKLVYNQDWDAVIRFQEKVQSPDIIEQYFYNLALAEKGQLCNRMFFSPQNYGSISLTLTRDNEQAFRAMYFYYAVGLTGEAHHLAYELMVQHGFRPENIKMLIKTELINGNFKVAERYIDVLKKTFHYKKWAEKYEKMLYKPESVLADPGLGEKIRLLPGKDFFVVTDDFGNIERLLASNPGNRIAFEYKMARFLLEKDLKEVGSEVHKLKGMGYAHFPRHIEEAIVSLVNITNEFPDLGGLKISLDTDQRFIEYFTVLKAFKGNRKLIEKELKKSVKNTFWYYFQFGLVKSSFFKSTSVDNGIY